MNDGVSALQLIGKRKLPIH